MIFASHCSVIVSSVASLSAYSWERDIILMDIRFYLYNHQSFSVIYFSNSDNRPAD